MDYPYNQPLRRSPWGKSKAAVQPTKVPRAQWNHRAKIHYMEAYHEQIILGNTLNGQNNLCTEGWRNFLSNLQERTNFLYSMDMVKNAFQKLKREYMFVKDLIHGLTGAGLGLNGNLEMDGDWWEAKDSATKRKASKFRNVNLVPYRDLGPAIFEGKCARGDYAIAPNNYSNTIYAAGEDDNDSDPDLNEGSVDSGDALGHEPPQWANIRNISGSSGSSGKRKCLIMEHNSQLTSCRRRLEGYDFFGGSTQTTGYSKGKMAATSGDGIPTISECMFLIKDLEKNNLPLHIYACGLIKDPLNRELLAGFTTDVGRMAWIEASQQEDLKKAGGR